MTGFQVVILWSDVLIWLLVAAGVGKNVRNDNNAALMKHQICFWCGWAVGAYYYNFAIEFVGVLLRDLTAKGSWYEDNERKFE